ncbi:2-amino-4-hydroxy-6-hydroxymethyldihydropteridine diphosphokinase [Campylobacter geochelonis]|uniref:2-amino-4-hydroxy-6-hydroxymethyldihydropteridine pyrophosphokinase n=1 Tax=Campylobacter geochelonis TaxID=1780362 RepID=A0A128EJ61_9BACT|nr:2-amino-4-hydroxy-6-hydroxymethyldihydropteridine diphosphokinase [Campylobacter geochelonis]QKF70736.1 6-hydroxymethyl-7,8-dihydropterin pyrophosphokinase [Campylobacter geochelonis]CZE48581.1 2-amino-4-hydroxy-6-hydroxymethyldihydropteridinepyrophosphokinase [Campylobacter geochelonis]
MEILLLKNGFFSLKDALKLTKSVHFPFYQSEKENYKYEFYLGIGGNLGDSKKRFEMFFKKFKDDKRFFVVQTSPLLLNKAFGYTKQPDFLNAVLRVQTSLNPNQTLKIMQHYEKIFGRKRSFKNAPRTLDLDILSFSAKTRADKRLILPHPGIYDRISVILPAGLM